MDETGKVEDGRNYWDRHAQRDPLWAILSDATKRHGGWDIARFLRAGIAEIESLLYELDAQDRELRRGAALDFGCGVGRLTQALAPHFDRVVGVDISPRMLELAARLNQHPQTVSYVCNSTADLRVFEDRSFDFIVSTVVLQHVQPEFACSYLREFFRALAPSGIGVFQLPSHHRRADDRPLESIVQPMPDDAYHASLVVAGMPRGIRPASQITLQIEIANTSSVDWAQREYGVLSVGNHWLDGGGRLVTRDDGRARLPATLRAGERCRVPLTVNAPPNRGDYHCEVDVVHEGVLWFRDRGAGAVRLAVRVDEEATDAGPAMAHASHVEPPKPIDTTGLGGATTDIEDPGEFPMYGVSIDLVVRLIAEQGAALLHIENDRSAGEDWVSYRYFVQKKKAER